MDNNVQPLLLDTVAASRFLGVGTGTIRGWVNAGLPFIRAGKGGKKFYTKKDLEKWIERQKESAA